MWKANGAALRDEEKKSEEKNPVTTVALCPNADPGGPFGNFIAVALSTLLTILLAWRVLFEDENSITRRPQESKSKLKAEYSKVTARLLDAGLANSVSGKVPGMEPNRPDDPAGGYESDVSTIEEESERPLYLDTITEEDTDDLRSLSSADGQRSPLHIPLILPDGSSQGTVSSAQRRPLSIDMPKVHEYLQSAKQVRNDGTKDEIDEFATPSADISFDVNGSWNHVSKKSPSEERFLQAYHNYLTTATINISSGNTTDATVYENERTPVRDTFHCDVSSPYSDARMSGMHEHALLQNGVSNDDQYAWLEISPSNHYANTTVHTLSHNDCVANGPLANFSPRSATDFPAKSIATVRTGERKSAFSRLDHGNLSLISRKSPERTKSPEAKNSQNPENFLRGVDLGKNNFALDPKQSAVIENNKTSPQTMSGFMKEECKTLNSKPNDSLRVGNLNSSSLSQHATENKGLSGERNSDLLNSNVGPQITSSGTNYYLPNSRLISTVQYRPPGISIKNSKFDAQDNFKPNPDLKSDQNDPSDRDENANMNDSYVRSRYERSMEIERKDEKSDYRFYQREYAEEVRSKPPPARGRIPWATASVFPAQDETK